MKRKGLIVIAAIVFLAMLTFISYAQEKPKMPTAPAQPGEIKRAPSLPPLPDLIIVGHIRLAGTPSFVGEEIRVPISYRIENRGTVAAGPFMVSIFQQYDDPPGSEGELSSGQRTFSGLRPSREVGGLNATVNVNIHRSFAGQKVKIRAIVDSLNQVIESDESLNHSPWLEVRLPQPERVELPDLYIVNFSYEGKTVNFMNFPPGIPVPVAVGDSKRVEITIGNWGPADVRVGDISVGIYLSTERAGGCRPTSIMLWGTVISTGLRLGGTRSFSTTINIPTTLASGNYWMYPMVDAPNRIAERNEENNCFTSVPLMVTR